MLASGKPFSASTRESCQVSLSIRVISIQLREVCVFAPSSAFDDAVSHRIMTVLAIFELHENLIRRDELIINGNGWPFAVINAEKFPWNFFSDLKWRHSSFTHSYRRRAIYFCIFSNFSKRSLYFVFLACSTVHVCCHFSFRFDFSLSDIVFSARHHSTLKLPEFSSTSGNARVHWWSAALSLGYLGLSIRPCPGIPQISNERHWIVRIIPLCN